MATTRILVDPRGIKDVSFFACHKVKYLFTGVSHNYLRNDISHLASRYKQYPFTAEYNAVTALREIGKAAIVFNDYKPIITDKVEKSPSANEVQSSLLSFLSNNNHAQFDYLVTDNEELKAKCNNAITPEQFKAMFTVDKQLLAAIEHNSRDEIAFGQSFTLLYILPVLLLLVLTLLLFLTSPSLLTEPFKPISILYGVCAVIVGLWAYNLKVKYRAVYGGVEVLFGVVNTCFLYNQGYISSAATLFSLFQLIAGIYIIISGIENIERYYSEKGIDIIKNILPAELVNNKNLKDYYKTEDE